MTLLGTTKTWDIELIDNEGSAVFNFDPPYWNNDARLYQKPDTLNLIIEIKQIIDTIGFPTLRLGECKHLVIDKELKIINP